MSKKKGGKASKVPPPDIYTLMTIDEVQELEQRYTNRVTELRANAIHFFSEALTECHKINEKQHELDVWNAYANCDHIPRPYSPPDIRTFFEKQKFNENRKIAVNIDWLLSIDERSILTQNIFRQDMTRATISKTSKRDFGKDYEHYIDDALNLLKRIEYFLRDPSGRDQISDSIVEDIISMKPLLNDKIKDAFNYYTYRLLSNEEAYMKIFYSKWKCCIVRLNQKYGADSIDAITSEYTFTCNNFDMHIWSLKNVPIRFTHLPEPRMIANLHNLNMILHIPFSMLRLELTIQGIRMNFDIFSENATLLKSRERNAANFNYNIPNLSDCLLSEWTLIREIQERVREKLILLRENYEEKVKLIKENQEKEAKMTKQRQDIPKGKKHGSLMLRLPTVAPQILGPTDYPDVYTDFIKEEDERYRKYVDETYNPQSFHLFEDEINLKKYVILGGVYQLCCVQKPKHFDFSLNRFNMTTHSPQRNLIVEPDFCIKVEPSELATELSELDIRRFTRNTLMIDSEIDSNNPWFVLVFYLPKDLCLWAEPIACHFETTEVEMYKSIQKLKTAMSVSKIRGPKTKNVTLHSEGAESKLAQSKHLFADSRLDSRLPRSQYAIPLQLSQYVGDEEGVRFIPNINDFALNGIYDIAQTAFIERFCVPQVISSYKFPREINEEISRQEEGKSKGKGGILIAKPTSKIVETTNALFSYDENQTNPERVFPVYMRSQLYNIHRRLSAYYDDLPHEPTTFYQLSRVLTLIKAKFKERPQNIINLPQFESKASEKSRRKGKKTKPEELEIPVDSVRSSMVRLSINHATLKSPRRSTESRISARTLKSTASNMSMGVTPSHSHTSLHDKKEKEELEKTEEVEKHTITYTKWTTRHIRKFNFKKDECKCTIETDRLGFIGFAFKRYIHFPFKYWELQPSDTDPENEVIFTLETQFVKCVLKVNGEGISGYVTDIGKKYVRNPKMYLVIDQPMRDYTEFKKRFKENNINIFADEDASFYIERGNFCEKHLPLEFHTYACMAINCNQVKFNHSVWNALSQRRDIILEFVGYSDNADNKVLVHLTPEQATFVEIFELCTMDVRTIELEYKPTWRNIGNYSDLHQMILSMYLTANDYRCKNAKLICYLTELLREIRPFSFS